MNAVRCLNTAALMLLFTAGSVSADTVAPPATTEAQPPSVTAPSPSEPETAAPAAEKMRTEVVFCIDCSGSMSQSITRAQGAMKYLVDEMQAQTPDAPISVGIIRYGTGMNPLEVLPLTNEPKTIDNYLSRLKINGGAEFVGKFIKDAVEQMKWSQDSNVIRKIIVVGNETAFQGPIDYRLAAKAAFGRGFNVSAMYCPSIFEEQGANIARATATTRIRSGSGGTWSRNNLGHRGMLGVENTWLLTAYYGGGEVMKLSANPRNPVLRYSPMEVAQLVEEIIPQQEALMAQADAAFAAYDMNGGANRATRGIPVRSMRGRR